MIILFNKHSEIIFSCTLLHLMKNVLIKFRTRINCRTTIVHRKNKYTKIYSITMSEPTIFTQYFPRVVDVIVMYNHCVVIALLKSRRLHVERITSVLFACMYVYTFITSICNWRKASCAWLRVSRRRNFWKRFSAGRLKRERKLQCYCEGIMIIGLKNELSLREPRSRT